MDKEITKKRFKRDKPNKKWTEKEIKKILNYLQDAPEIEAPTAQIFYKKFIERTHIDATWELIRWKVRHLKASFTKANDWRNSTGAGFPDLDTGTSSIEGKVLQMCPHFKQLNEIFGDKNSNGHFVVTDSGDWTTMEDSQIVETIDPMLEPYLSVSLVETVDPAYGEAKVECISPSTGAKKSSPTQSSIDLMQNASYDIPKKPKYFGEKFKKNGLKSSAAHLAAFQAGRTEMFRIKLEWEREKHEKELALSERKLKLEEEKLKREMDFKVLQLEKEENLKILEIEKDERVQKFEIEMRYKWQLEK